MALSAPLSVGEGVGGRHHLHLKRAFLRIKERLPLHQRNAPFVCKQYYPLPSPFGEGAGVRLVVDEDKACSLY